MIIKHLNSIRLTADDMPVSARLSSARSILSPTSPKKPQCIVGWCDRWWIDNQPGKNVAIRYWIFESPEYADKSATDGRVFLSARMIYLDGKLESIFQPETDVEGIFGDKTWSWDNHILFVKGNVVVLVSESGQKVDLITLRSIARRIEEKIEAVL